MEQTRDSRSLGELFAELSRHTGNLVRQEIALAKAEVRQQASKVGKDVASIAAGGAIEFDLAYFLSGEEANQAYQEATGDSGPVPNDHFVVNDNPMLRTLSLAPDVRLRLLDWNNCCDTFFDGELALFAEAIGEQADVTDGGLIYRGQSQWWITVENGVVTEIEEQYSP